jgi:hypothetical protein
MISQQRELVSDTTLYLVLVPFLIILELVIYLERLFVDF